MKQYMNNEKIWNILLCKDENNKIIKPDDKEHEILDESEM